jgi:hypothetical protein
VGEMRNANKIVIRNHTLSSFFFKYSHLILYLIDDDKIPDWRWLFWWVARGRFTTRWARGLILV